MAGIIDSAPECISKDPGSTDARVEDSADFVMGDPYTECAGFMTFGPGSTYGEEGIGGETIYLVLTWAGIVFMVLALVAWIVYENRRLIAYSLGAGRTHDESTVPPPAVPPTGMTPDVKE